MVPWTCFEMWRPCFPHGVHHYRIVLRGERTKVGGVASEEDGAGHGEDARSAS